MKNLSIAIFMFTAICLAALPGCPHNPNNPATLSAVPDPITLDQQLARLNANAAQFPALKAHGKVTLTFTDPQNKTHVYQADGTLLMQRPALAAPSSPPAPDNFILSGYYLGQSAFELGENSQQFWLVIRGDAKTAYIGSVANLSQINPRAMPLRPDRLLSVLTITPLLPDTHQHFEMRVLDDSTQHPAANILRVINVDAAGHPWLDRELIINRRTGHVDHVLMYDRTGQLLADAMLNNWRQLPETSSGPGPFLPFSIAIDYPSQKARIELQIANASTQLNITPNFDPPDFHGLEVTNLDPTINSTTAP